jgi:hypothetical protein
MGQSIVIPESGQTPPSRPRSQGPSAEILPDWPWEEALREVDLDLEDRSRVSALPWRGQFSPMTVERLMRALAPAGGTVVDPFVGSGTALLEAARSERPSIGLDVNPAAVAFARCAALASLAPDDREARLDAACALVEREGVELPGLTGTIQLAHAVALLGRGGSVEAAKARLGALLWDLPDAPTETKVLLGDARATGLPAGSADFVVTSPPYINVFNYHQFGRPLSDAFGWPVLAAARSEIGSNRQNRSNRFRTVVQYAIDMGLVVAEIARLLRDRAVAVLVLGRVSRVRGVAFMNGGIVGELAEAMNAFDARTKAQRFFVNRFGETIAEDVLVLRRGGAASVPDDLEVTELGRSVGRRALEGASATSDAREELAAAIEDVPRIGPSPMIAPDLELA